MKKKIKILLADGEVRWAKFSQKTLSKHGYKVEIDFDPERALERLAEEKYAAVILDTSVLGTNGMVILKRIHDKYPKERVIIVSASPSWQEGKEAYFKGAIDYVSKNFNELSLLKVLEENLLKKTSHRIEGSLES